MLFYLMILAALFCLYCLIVWIRDENRFVVVSYEVVSPKIKKPCSFVILSDLHNKAYGKGNKRLSGAVLKLQPDGVIVTGDMYTSKAGTGFNNAVDLLADLSEKLPVYYANGNHEQKTRLRPQVYGDMYERYTGRLKEMGIEPIINGHVYLPEFGIDICGSEIGQQYFRHFKKEPFTQGYLDSLLGAPRKDAFQILAAHNPDYFEEYVQWGADLVLSGHVHGGVVRLPFLGGMISPSIHLFPRYDGGRFTYQNSTMLLSRGLGMHTIPVRVWNPGEVVYVKLLPG